ncbi:hypothetical protein [Nocardia aurantia]|uniref:PPE family domain-containing protein n=1 Tax=Nocardia aurantia TaxID=2585199 RepID=A0A7K0E1N6_9NOCA|nr:hypothetical protein [Nocardia aurantia]MQY31687.1 hypothetical protein [Nocardia aurantia]
MSIVNEPPHIADKENPSSFEHWDLYRAFHPQDTTDAHNAAEKYDHMARTWAADVATFAARIQRSSASAWEGPAAEASRAAINNYAQRAQDLTPALMALAEQVTTAATGIVNTKKGVEPEPQSTVGPWYEHAFNTDGWDFLHHGSRSVTKINEAKAKAQAAMQNNYLVDFVHADSRIPVLPEPVSPTSPLYSWQPGQAGVEHGPVGVGGNGYSGPNGTGGLDDGTAPGGDTAPGAQDQPADTSGPSADAAGSDHPVDGQAQGGHSNRDETRSAGTVPGEVTTRPTSFGPSAYPGGGGYGSAGPGGDVNGPLGASPGRAIPGNPTAAGASVRPMAAQAGLPGAPGMGMPGMVPPGRGKSEEDERAHKSPEWLKDKKNTEELLGTPPHTLPEGVIGVDEPAPAPETP